MSPLREVAHSCLYSKPPAAAWKEWINIEWISEQMNEPVNEDCKQNVQNNLYKAFLLLHSYVL